MVPAFALLSLLEHSPQINQIICSILLDGCVEKRFDSILRQANTNRELDICATPDTNDARTESENGLTASAAVIAAGLHRFRGDPRLG